MSDMSKDAAGPVVLVVPASSFDLLEDQYVRTARLRSLNRVAAAAMAALVALLLFQFVTTKQDADSTQTEADRLVADNNRVRADLGEKARAGAATRTQVDEHIAERTELIGVAAGGVVDFERVLRELSFIADGTEVTSISFGAPDAAPPTEGATSSSVPPAGGEPADAATIIASISVAGTATGVSEANAAIAALSDRQRFAYLIESGSAPVRCSGASGAAEAATSGLCNWTWTGVLTDAAAVQRAAVGESVPGGDEGGA